MSETMWRRRFGADPNVIGRSITVGGREFTIVGISPAGFPGLLLSDPGSDPDALPQLWAPLTASARDAAWLAVGGRLPRNVDVDAFAARLAVSATHAARASTVKHNPPALRWFRAGLDWTSDPFQSLVIIAVFLMVPLTILAIGCANVTNLQLARATDRARELSVRRALGASPGQLFRLLSLEPIVLTCVAAGVGWVVARLLLIGVQPLFAVPVSLDRRVVWLLLILVALVIGAAGAAPAVLALRTVISAGMKQAADSVPHKRLRAALVVVQVAASVVLLFICGLGVRTLRAQHDSLPPHAEDILTAGFNLSDVRQPAPLSSTFVDGVLSRLRNRGPVHAAAFATFLGVGHPIRFRLSGDDETISRSAYAGEVTSDWFEVMEIHLLAGREPRGGGRQTEVVINRTLALQLGSLSTALGKRLQFVTSDGSPDTHEVVGVVEDQLLSRSPMAFLPMPATPPSALVLVVRATDGAAAVPLIREAIRQTEPLAPADSIRSLAASMNEVFSGLRGMVLVGLALGGLAVLLAGVGEYAVLAFSVRRRTREIGIRVAVGADRRSIVRLVVRHALSMTAVGLALGFAVAVPIGIVMRSMFVGITPLDPLTVVPVAAGMLLVAVAAAVLPGLRGVRVDPLVALRDE
jgi:predicted permease